MFSFRRNSLVPTLAGRVVLAGILRSAPPAFPMESSRPYPPLCYTHPSAGSVASTLWAAVNLESPSGSSRWDLDHRRFAHEATHAIQDFRNVPQVRTKAKYTEADAY